MTLTQPPSRRAAPRRVAPDAPDAPGGPAEPGLTPRVAWTLLVLSGIGLAVARVPGAYAEIGRRLPPEVVASLEESRLLELSVRVGVVLAVVVYAFCLGIAVSLARLLERRLCPDAAVGTGRRRVGVHFAALALTLVPLHVGGLVAGRPVLHGAPLAAVLGALALALPLVFRAGPRRTSPGHYLAVAASLALVTGAVGYA